MAHRDGYTSLRLLRRRPRSSRSTLGLPQPVALRRHVPGRPLVDGPVLVGGHGGHPGARRPARRALAAGARSSTPCPRTTGWAASSSTSPAPTTPADLEALRATLGPALSASAAARRVVVVGRDPRRRRPLRRAATRRALEGVTRSVAKELRAGATANLVLVTDGAEAAGARHASVPPLRPGRPTSTARSSAVGAGGRRGSRRDRSGRWPARSPSSPARPAASAPAIARTLARDGATVVVRRRARGRRRARDRRERDRRHRAPGSTSPPPTPGSASSTTPPPATAGSTSSCTTPASCATSCSPTPTRTAGRSVARRQPAVAPADERGLPRRGRPAPTAATSCSSRRRRASRATAGRPTTPPPRPA